MASNYNGFNGRLGYKINLLDVVTCLCFRYWWPFINPNIHLF
ncbi:hypothetical protein [Candidatus Hodgkinia cicadicola]